MFEWDDQELANIIWEEDGEADDHIVPFREEIPLQISVDNAKRELIFDPSNSIIADKRIPTSELVSQGVRLDKDGSAPSAEVLESQRDLSSFTASSSDQTCLAKKHEREHTTEVSQNQLQDKELSEFVENSWTTIGSFDDLDHIFSNENVVGSSPLGGTHELWPSLGNMISARETSLAMESSWGLRTAENTSDNLQMNVHDQNLSAAHGYRKTDSFLTYGQNLQGSLDSVNPKERTTGILKEKAALNILGKSESYQATEKLANQYKSVGKYLQDYWCKDQLKNVHEIDKCDNGLLEEEHCLWLTPSVHSQQSDSQCVPAMVQQHSSLLDLQRKTGASGSSLHQHLSSPNTAPYAYGNYSHQYTAMPVLQSDGPQLVLSGSKNSPGDLASVNRSAKLLNMTPQEKIEKLRRRQQLRAMLAIKNQQQQLILQVPTAGYSMLEGSLQHDQTLHVRRAVVELEDSLTATGYDPRSPIKWGDSHRIQLEADDDAVEDNILYELHDVISKLDMKIRLCIRDSIFRLAQSARQRHSVRDTSNTNKSNLCESNVFKEEISGHDRVRRKPNVETETNHIDRAVARLLFHQHLKLPEKHSRSADSSTCTKASSGQTGVLSSVPVGFSTNNSENEQTRSAQGSGPHSSVNSHQEGFFKDIPQHESNTNQRSETEDVTASKPAQL